MGVTGERSGSGEILTRTDVELDAPTTLRVDDRDTATDTERVAVGHSATHEVTVTTASPHMISSTPPSRTAYATSSPSREMSRSDTDVVWSGLRGCGSSSTWSSPRSPSR